MPAPSNAAKRSRVPSSHTRAKPSPRRAAVMFPTSAAAAGISVGVPNVPLVFKLPTRNLGAVGPIGMSWPMRSWRARYAVPALVVTSAVPAQPHCRGE